MSRASKLFFGPALLSLAACPPPPQPPPPDVTLDPPALGFQHVVGPFPVPALSELQDCYYFRVPTDTWVHEFQIVMNPGSHHMNMFRVNEPSAGIPACVAAGDPVCVQHGCWDSLPFQDWGLLVNSQVSTSGSDVDWTLPDGIAAHLTAGELLMLQTHYVNATTQSTENGHGKVIVNFVGMDPLAVTDEMGTMFANNRNIFLRAGQTSSFTSLCTVPSAVTLIAASGHFHSRGTDFTIAIGDPAGNVGPNIYENTVWDNPIFQTYNTNPQPIQAGGGLVYTCDFFNFEDYDIVFGPHVEFEEHCNVFAFYYPRLTNLGALYCF